LNRNVVVWRLRGETFLVAAADDSLPLTVALDAGYMQ
jgi:hypothetical protein